MREQVRWAARQSQSVGEPGVGVAGYHDQTEAIAPAPSSLPSSAHRGRGQAHTELVLVVVVLPAAPWTVTTGCVARAVPLVGVLLRRPYSAASLAAEIAWPT